VTTKTITFITKDFYIQKNARVTGNEIHNKNKEIRDQRRAMKRLLHE
jgi:hypothetical protein